MAEVSKSKSMNKYSESENFLTIEQKVMFMMICQTRVLSLWHHIVVLAKIFMLGHL